MQEQWRLLDYGQPVGVSDIEYIDFSPDIDYSNYTLVDIALFTIVQQRNARATQSYAEIISLLLQDGAPIRVSISYIIETNYPGMLYHLIKCILPTEFINVKSHRGSTALYEVAKEGCNAIVQLLLDSVKGKNCSLSLSSTNPDRSINETFSVGQLNVFISFVLRTRLGSVCLFYSLWNRWLGNYTGSVRS